MRHFIVEVGYTDIVVRETNRPLSNVHVRAVVDGVRHVYKIQTKKYAKPYPNAWRERGANQAYYHARNAGNVVRFEPVNRKPKKAKEVSDKQKAMF